MLITRGFRFVLAQHVAHSRAPQRKSVRGIAPVAVFRYAAGGSCGSVSAVMECRWACSSACFLLLFSMSRSPTKTSSRTWNCLTRHRDCLRRTQSERKAQNDRDLPLSPGLTGIWPPVCSLILATLPRGAGPDSSYLVHPVPLRT